MRPKWCTLVMPLLNAVAGLEPASLALAGDYTSRLLLLRALSAEMAGRFLAGLTSCAFLWFLFLWVKYGCKFFNGGVTLSQHETWRFLFPLMEWTFHWELRQAWTEGSRDTWVPGGCSVSILLSDSDTFLSELVCLPYLKTEVFMFNVFAPIL